MGNYVFDADALVEAVTRDATTDGSKHDMGGDIVPAFVRRAQAGVYDYKDNVVPGSTDRDRGYWRDVGTLGSYYAAHMDVVSPLPVFNLYNFDWPIYTSYGPQPPAKLVQGADGVHATRRRGGAVARGRGQRRHGASSSVLSPSVRVGTGAQRRGLGAAERRPDRRRRDGAQRDPRQERRRPARRRGRRRPGADEKRGFLVEDGLTVLGKDQPFPADAG